MRAVRPDARRARPKSWTFPLSGRKAPEPGRTVPGLGRVLAGSGRTVGRLGRTVAERRVFIDNLAGTAAAESKDAAVPEGLAAQRRACAGGVAPARAL